MLPNYLVYAPLLMVFLLEILAIGVLVAYFSFLKKFQQVDDAYRKLKRETLKHENEVLEAARTQGQKIIAEAQRKAETLVAHAADRSNQYAAQFGQELGKVSKEQIALYQKVLDESRKETSAMMKQVAEETRTLSVKEVENLRQRLVEQAEQSQSALSAAIASAFAKAETQIEAYKQERFTFIEGHAVELVSEIAQAVLPRELTLQQHEDVILAAMDEAKKDRVFEVEPKKLAKTANRE
jgi:F0F1-type ATP synthase membrane subunit b/b'